MTFPIGGFPVERERLLRGAREGQGRRHKATKEESVTQVKVRFERSMIDSVKLFLSHCLFPKKKQEQRKKRA